MEKESPDLAQKLKDQMKEADEKTTENENGSGDAPAPNGNGTAKVPRDNTMVQTAQVCYSLYTVCLSVIPAVVSVCRLGVGTVFPSS